MTVPKRAEQLEIPFKCSGSNYSLLSLMPCPGPITDSLLCGYSGRAATKQRAAKVCRASKFQHYLRAALSLSAHFPKLLLHPICRPGWWSGLCEGWSTFEIFQYESSWRFDADFWLGAILSTRYTKWRFNRWTVCITGTGISHSSFKIKKTLLIPKRMIRYKALYLMEWFGLVQRELLFQSTTSSSCCSPQFFKCALMSITPMRYLVD